MARARGSQPNSTGGLQRSAYISKQKTGESAHQHRNHLYALEIVLTKTASYVRLSVHVNLSVETGDEGVRTVTCKCGNDLRNMHKHV